MDLNFVDPSEAPVPPEDVEVRRVDLRPLADGKRISVQLELTPFMERPSLEVRVRDPAGETVASTSIIESVNHQLEFTIHLKQPPSAGTYEFVVETFIGENKRVDIKRAEFALNGS